MPIRYKDGEPFLDPAKMKARITFLEQVTGMDASGTKVTYAAGSPPDVTSAEIVPIRGTDLIKAGQEVSLAYVSATIRFRPPGRSANTRFRDSRGRVYIIQAVDDVAPGALKYQVLTSLLISAAA